MLLKPQQLRLYIFIAMASLFVTVGMPYLGEEAVYTIGSYEMWYYHNYLVNTLFGIFYGRPPLLNWFIIPFAKEIGWQNVLIVSRLVSACSTILVAAGTYGFVKRLTRNKNFALLCTAIYLTGDLLFIRGWLAYADPLLSFFIFFSIVFLWLGVDEKRRDFFIFGVIFLSAGFLVKALSPYWFYGLAGLVLLIFHPNRKFLLQPASIGIHIGALIFPFAWNVYADPRYLLLMWSEITSTYFSPGVGKYIYQILIVQPGMLFVRLAPLSLVALYAYFKNVKNKVDTEFRNFSRIAFWFAALSFATCCIAPRWPEARYYMPVFPFMAICMAYVIWNANANIQKITAFLLMLILIAKIGFVGYFYYRYEYVKPNYYAVAKDVLRIVKKAPLFVDMSTAQSAPVEKVAIYLDLMRYPISPLFVTPPMDPKARVAYNLPSRGECPGFYVIGQKPTAYDRIIRQYSEKKQLVYLFCRT